MQSGLFFVNLRGLSGDGRKHCGRFLAALGGLAALLALFDKCYQEAAVSAIVAFLLSPYGAPQVLFWLGRKLLEFAGSLYDLYY